MRPSLPALVGTAAVLTAASAATLLLAVPAGAAPQTSEPCAATKIVSVTTSADDFSVGTTKTRPVDLYVAVQDACSSAKVSVTISSPGKTRTLVADKVNRVQGSGLNGAPVDLTYYTTGFDLVPKLLAATDAGSWRVVAHLDTDLGATDTPGPFFRVRHATRTTFDASPEPVKAGKGITLVGHLSEADWSTRKYVPHPHSTMTLEWRPADGPKAFQRVSPVAVDDGAAWGGLFTLTRSGCFRGVYAGDETTSPVTSHTDCVAVR